MISFNFEPWRSDTKIELCSEMQCFELRDKDHRIKVYFRKSDNKSVTTLIIDLQKKEGCEEYVKKMLGGIVSGTQLEDHRHMSLLYKSSMALFTNGGRSDIYVEWEEEGAMLRAKAVLDKNRVYVLFKVLKGPYDLFYQTEKEVGANTEDHDKILRYFLSKAVYLYRLFKEYTEGKPASQ